MEHIHFVEKARKNNPVAKKGESYWWWSFKFGVRKHFSKERPTPEQIILSAQEENPDEDFGFENLEEARHVWAQGE